MYFLKTILISCVILCSVSSIQAASPKDVEKVVRLVQMKSGTFDRDACDQSTTWSTYFQAEQTYDIAFYRKDSPRLSCLMYTFGYGDYQTSFEDCDLDGKVDYGEGPHEKEKYFSDGNIVRGAKEGGLEFRAHWQEQYDQAITNTIAYFKNHK